MGRGLRTAAKAAPRKHNVDPHIRRVNSQRGCQRRLVERGKLRAHPELGLAVGHFKHGVQRFECGMGKIGEVEFCLDHLSGPVDPFHGVADLFGGTAPFCSGAGKISVDLFGRPRFSLAVVPRHAQRLAPFQRGTGVFRINGNALRDLAHRDHAGYLQRIGIVKAGHDSTHLVGVGHDDGLHSVAVHIHRVFRLAGRLGVGIQLGHIGPDQDKILGLLQLGLRRCRHSRGFLGEGTKARFGALGVRNAPLRYGNLGRGHAPFRGGSIHQHRARSGAGFAHLQIAVRHRRGPACPLQSEQGIGVEFIIGRRTFGAHLRPVGVQLFGHQGRETGVWPLTEFDMLDDDRHRVIRRDADKCVWCEGSRISRRIKSGSGTGLGA